MPLPQDYLEGMISPPVVSPEVVGPNNVRVDQQLYRDAQRMVGMTKAERVALEAAETPPHIAEVTTVAGERAAKQTVVDAAMHEGEVADQEVATLEVTPAAPSIAVAATQQLTAVAKNAEGFTIEGAEVEYESSDVTKATVSDSGLVTGVAAGSATITATCNGKTDTVAVTVTA